MTEGFPLGVAWLIFIVLLGLLAYLLRRGRA
jgi:hypothetical protein